MIIPISVILIPLALFLLIFIIFALFNFYHVFRYGFGDLTLFFGTFFFICASALIFFYAFQLLRGVDFNYPLLDLRSTSANSNFFPR